MRLRLAREATKSASRSAASSGARPTARDGDELWLDFDGACRRFVDRTYAPPRLKDEDADGAVRSPVSGVIVGVEAKAGDRVRRGQALATVEAMKMQYSILAPIEGVITEANAVRRRPGAGARAPVRHRARTETIEMDKAVVTCALTGVLTDPAVYPAPVTPEEMAREARRACDEGASVVHVHFRRLEPGKGHLPSWEPEVATAVVAAIRDACPGVIVNQTTGVVGADIAGPLACLARGQARDRRAQRRLAQLPEDARRRDLGVAADAVRQSGREGRARSSTTMRECAIEPEFECFDTGIVRTAAAIARNCGYGRAAEI